MGEGGRGGRPRIPDVGMPTEQRLATVVYGDVVGYSKLMARDETNTHSRWMTILHELIQPAAKRHGREIVQIMGDGFIAELPSAEAAFRFAQTVQDALLDDFPTDGAPPIVMRMAIHSGEMTFTDGFVFGNALNLAARLQELAEPGGVVLSEAALAGLRGIDIGPVRDLGLVPLKNFDRPERVYALGESLPSASPLSPGETLLPSLVVLPFANLGGDPADGYLADGLVDDVVVSLSRLHEILVISRGSGMALRDTTDPQAIGRALGARYVVRGTLRRAGSRLRITSELCDTETGQVVFSDRVDADAGELFEVQDDITARVASGVAPKIRRHELQRALRKRPGSFTAYDLMLRAIDGIERLERSGFAEARGFLQGAIERDPYFAMAYAQRSRWHSLNSGQGWSTDAADDAAQCVASAARAVALDPTNALGVVHLAFARSFLYRDPDSAIPLFDRALQLSPNLARGWMLSSAPFAYLGNGEEALRRAKHAFRLSPLDPQRYQQSFFLGLANYANGNWDEAARWCRRSLQENASYSAPAKVLAAASAALGRKGDARVAWQSLLALEPGFRLEEYLGQRAPFVDPDLSGAYAAHLRLAERL